MFECMEISETMYEGAEEPSYKKSTRVDSNSSSHNKQMRGEAVSLGDG